MPFKVIPSHENFASRDYYFYRFRVTDDHWSRKKGWMVGMAGGFARVNRGTVENNGCTFSMFKQWDEMPLSKHIAVLMTQVEQLARHRNKSE